MTQDELNRAERQIRQEINDIQQKLKETQKNQEELAQLSKESQGFLEDTLGFLQGSSESHMFQEIYESQVLLDKKIKVGFEREYDVLEQDYRHKAIQVEELVAKRQKLEKEESHGC